MGIEGIITDIIVDICSEKDIRGSSDRKPDKIGFSLGSPYIPSRTTLKGKRDLITEDYLKKMIAAGNKRIKIHADSIITPLARLLIDERRIHISRI